MPRATADPALKWLLTNDPQARQMSHEEYARRRGILTAKRRGAINKHEVSLEALTDRRRDDE